ncbi:hypothetical protein FH972_014956 [Carpinus fangiana]|uniref:Uncharacterized protein n=1 Tax=Carpinus fangiana TaxID=176857 RepID=A0A5N6RCB9_9ROSI|nr:hypothetical protein FH972_014956 [Carpinus fangiana]
MGYKSNFSKLDLRPSTCPSLSRASATVPPTSPCSLSSFVCRRQPLHDRTSTSGFLVATASAWSSRVGALFALVGLTPSPPLLVLLFSFESFLITVLFVVVASILQRMVFTRRSVVCTSRAYSISSFAGVAVFLNRSSSLFSLLLLNLSFRCAATILLVAPFIDL